MTAYIALIAALTGLLASHYIYRKKRKKTKMICPLRANCEKVIHSTYATSFHIPNELLGIGYFATVGILYALLVFSPGLFLTPLVAGSISLIVFCGMLFSLYLIAVQVLMLRAWCSWCMLSALANAILFICTFVPISSIARF